MLERNHFDAKLVARNARVAEKRHLAEITAQIQQTAFDFLRAPIQRVGAPFTPVPLSPPLEDAYRVGAEAVVAAALEAVAWDQPEISPAPGI